jgi:hypothetical protein
MEVLGIEPAVSASNVTLVTTAETVIISSNPMALERPGASFLIKAWAQLTTGTDTATVTARIRRGTTAAGTLVNEANAVTIGAAVTSTEVFTAWAMEQRADESQVQYCLTLTMNSASANGTALQAGIEVTQLA